MGNPLNVVKLEETGTLIYPSIGIFSQAHIDAPCSEHYDVLE
jgi:hypothetical protein